jgi:tetratricopeptide (TPR) repeat protein
VNTKKLSLYESSFGRLHEEEADKDREVTPTIEQKITILQQSIELLEKIMPPLIRFEEFIYNPESLDYDLAVYKQKEELFLVLNIINSSSLQEVKGIVNLRTSVEEWMSRNNEEILLIDSGKRLRDKGHFDLAKNRFEKAIKKLKEIEEQTTGRQNEEIKAKIREITIIILGLDDIITYTERAEKFRSSGHTKTELEFYKIAREKAREQGIEEGLESLEKNINSAEKRLDKELNRKIKGLDREVEKLIREGRSLGLDQGKYKEGKKELEKAIKKYNEMIDVAKQLSESEETISNIKSGIRRVGYTIDHYDEQMGNQ